MQLLHRSRISFRWFLPLLLFSLSLPAVTASRVLFQPWPEAVGTAEESLSLGSPELLSWDYLTLRLKAPVRMTVGGAQHQGTVTLEARTFANRPRQTISLRQFRAAALEMPGGKGEGLLPVATRLLQGWHAETALEDFLAAFVDEKRLPSVAISSEAPQVFVSEKPAVLLQFDGPPMWLPVEDTKISYAVNTNWDIFYDNASTFYYLLAGDQWLATHDPFSNEWVLPRTLPKDIRKLPHTPDFANVWAHLPYKPNPDAQLPRVIYSEKAAELILFSGAPQWEAIPGTGLQAAGNSASDVFYHPAQQRYFYLVAGRWYAANSLDAYWRNAGELPADFAAIPADHPRAHVRVHVPGTAQSKLEALWAQVPQIARIRRAEAELKVDFAGRPKYTPIDGSPMLWVPNATYPVLAKGQDLYACHQAVWFHATSPEGPWTLADALPAEIYHLPPNSPVHHLSYVRLVESDADSVSFGYTGGYENLFVHDGVVVYGTGHSYPPALQYGAYAYPVYFAQPSTFGAGAWYSLEFHTFLRGRPGYGPFGGFGATCRYNSITSHYFRAQTLYGSAEGQEPMMAFLPYTRSYGDVFRAYDPYGSWGKALLREPGAAQRVTPAVAIKPGKPTVGAPTQAGEEGKRPAAGQQGFVPPKR